MSIYTDDELKKIQKLELMILKDVIEVCEKLNLDYFVCGGTALGAVRHNGFIPWDDDIDISLMREDYEIFLKEAPALLPEKYHLQTPYNENEICPYIYSKVRLNDTKFVEYRNRNVKMNQGIYIDIFPMDEIPDDELLNKKQYRQVMRLTNLYVYKTSPDIVSPPKTYKEKAKYIIRRLCHYFTIFIPKKWLIDALKKSLTRYNGTGQSCVGGISVPVRNSSKLAKETLFPLKKHKFEDIYVNIPNDYDSYLKNEYGNYMKYPAPELRFGHKPYYFDFGDY